MRPSKRSLKFEIWFRSLPEGSKFQISNKKSLFTPRTRFKLHSILFNHKKENRPSNIKPSQRNTQRATTDDATMRLSLARNLQPRVATGLTSRERSPAYPTLIATATASSTSARDACPTAQPRSDDNNQRQPTTIVDAPLSRPPLLVLRPPSSPLRRPGRSNWRRSVSSQR